ncbi:MAG: 5-oxoprolinase subunit PxpB [Bacteroidia bacterium]|nr:5-oxoprolinase subunit PxpB [Bacteroidia bacterium]
MFPHIYPIASGAITVCLGDQIQETIHEQVLDLAAMMISFPFQGYRESVPAYASLAVYFDPVKVQKSYNCASPTQWVAAYVQAQYEQLQAVGQGTRPAGACHTIPVCYQAEMAPDMAEVTERLQCSAEEVIRWHTSCWYRVYMIGFQPGFPYMGILPSALHLSRKDRPVRRVPPGSVAIARDQTGIYPGASPGGWYVIGRTPVLLFDVNRQPPALLRPGDRVQMQPVSPETFEALTAGRWNST